jgi:hypothetical protein
MENAHAEVDPLTAADDPIDVDRFYWVSDQHLGIGGYAPARSSSRRIMAGTGCPRSRSRPLNVRRTAPS